jgi:hypothetical protein
VERRRQQWKHLSPMVSTVEGMQIEKIDEQFRNAAIPISVSEEFASNAIADK